LPANNNTDQDKEVTLKQLNEELVKANLYLRLNEGVTLPENTTLRLFNVPSTPTVLHLEAKQTDDNGDLIARREITYVVRNLG
jgi:hypothetical protein